MKHTFNASPERVYKAWTDPQTLHKFICPDEITCAEVKADVRVGGNYRITMVKIDGEQLGSLESTASLFRTNASCPPGGGKKTIPHSHA